MAPKKKPLKRKTAGKRKGKRSNKNTKRTILKGLIYLILLVFIISFLFYSVIILGMFGAIPSRQKLANINNYIASEVYSSDNYLLGRYYFQNRTNTSIEDVPDFFINALVATEDARFYSHKGIDARSSLRVLIKSILLFNKSSGGGSTITQQLAKNLYPRKSLGIFTLPVAKIKEMIIATRFEKVYTKSEILELYLNTVTFGENTYGLETGALVFFNKKPSELLPEESAMLVGMLKGTTDYNPRNNYDLALQRRNLVLSQMVKYKYISKEEYNSLINTPVKLNYRQLKHDEGPAPYLREYLRHLLHKWAENNPKPDGTKYNIYTDGLKIYTTIDYRLQSYAEKAVKKHMAVLQSEFDSHWKGKEPWKRNPQYAMNQIKQSKPYKKYSKEKLSESDIMEKMNTKIETKVFTWNGDKNLSISPIDSVLHHFAMLQTGFISMESKSGFIKAWVGGIDYRYFKYDHVTSHRQAGSTFKPLVYAEALENGISPCDFFANDSAVYTGFDNWVPRNADRKYGGYYSVKGALIHSVNTVSVNLLMQTGIKKVKELTDKLGFTGDIPLVPSLALGTGTVSIFELIKAYSLFSNEGKYVNPVIVRRIEDKEGNVLYTGGPLVSKETLISKQTCDDITAILCNVVNNGTASSLRTVYGIKSDIAGKTGTTQNHTDGWFVGYTPDLITAVWVGGDNPVVRFQSLTYGQGSHMALPIFAYYMKQVYSDPVYRVLINSRFNISEETKVRLDCEDFHEKKYDSIQDFFDIKHESIRSIIRRVFGRKRNKRKNDQD
ncbi:MAG: transglycosylase domain-containing protein [Bacteroidales bacterium]|nr:transglycosylase domain-containing protein [Bacteroidales bacterium]